MLATYHYVEISIKLASQFCFRQHSFYGFFYKSHWLSCQKFFRSKLALPTRIASVTVDPVREEAVGPAGPTTATRMDKFTRRMLETGLLGMVGKAERGPEAIKAIRDHRAAYLMAVGGSAYLVSKAIRAARVVGFEDLGMEAIHEFTVEDMPVTVAVDATGESVHETGPREWQARIGKIPLAVIDPA